MCFSPYGGQVPAGAMAGPGFKHIAIHRSAKGSVSTVEVERLGLDSRRHARLGGKSLETRRSAAGNYWDL
jgi:hypothetical protein